MNSTIRYLAFILLLIVVLVEIGLRISGRFRTYSEKAYGQYATYWNESRDNKFHSHMPNDSFYMEQPEFRYLYLTNSYGHRERAVEPSDSAGIVLIFGDSFAEGVGAPYDSTWPRFLETQLIDAGIDAHVYLCGSSGSDPYDSYMSLKELFLPYRPSHVIFTFNTSDLSDYAFRGGFSRYKGGGRVEFRKGKWWHPWYRYSHIVRAYIHQNEQYSQTLLTFLEWDGLQNEGVDSISHCLDLSMELCNSADARFLVITHAGPLEICRDDPSTRSIAKIEDHSYNVPIIHLNSHIEREISGDHCMDYGWPIDEHYNSKGYHVLANVLWQRISSEYPEFFSFD